jgi:hypothetical protein
MNKTTAEQRGLRFTGIYERFNDEKLQNRLKSEFRDKGYKAFIVTIPDSKYSRGPIGRGYSIYAEPKYFQDRTAEDMKRRIQAHPGVIQAMRLQLEKEIAILEAQNTERLRWLKDNGYSDN